MNKKTFMATIIIIAFFISLVAGMQVGLEVKANPIGWFSPHIDFTIQSPSDGAHVVLPILLNFTAHSNFGITLSNGSFFYVLDNQNVDSSGIRFTKVQSAGLEDFSGLANLTNLTAGKHYMIIYYVGMAASYPFGQINANSSIESTTSQFYIDSNITPSPTPSPTLSVTPTMTPSPSPTQQPRPSPTPNNTQENLTPILIIVALVVAVVFAGLLFYFRKTKKIGNRRLIHFNFKATFA